MTSLRWRLREGSQPCKYTDRVSGMVKYLHAQKPFPTLMICDVSVPLGHDSFEQSRTPLPKSMFEQRHLMSLFEQPKLPARPNMFWMHVFYISVSGSSLSMLFSTKAGERSNIHRSLEDLGVE